jgi:hypothetical protein
MLVWLALFTIHLDGRSQREVEPYKKYKTYKRGIQVAAFAAVKVKPAFVPLICLKCLVWLGLLTAQQSRVLSFEL